MSIQQIALQDPHAPLRHALSGGFPGASFEEVDRTLLRYFPAGLREAEILEVGSGRAVTCSWLPLAGARRVVGLEPEADGSQRGIFRDVPSV